MTDPNDDLSSIADPGSMETEQMTEKDVDQPGDVDVDNADRVDGDRQTRGTTPESQAIQGSPLGPPD